MAAAKANEAGGTDENSIKVASDMMEDLANRIRKSPAASDAFVTALLEDINGQSREAFSKKNIGRNGEGITFHQSCVPRRCSSVTTSRISLCRIMEESFL